MEALQDLLAGIPLWVNALTGVVTAATAVTALAPSKSDDLFLDSVLKILNVLAGNIARNINADAD